MSLVMRWGPPSSPDFWAWLGDKVAPSLITGVILVLLGSWLVARANEASKGRREHYVKGIDLLLQTLEDLQSAASEYWAKAGAYPALEAGIEYKLQILDTVLSTCVTNYPDKSSVTDSLYVQFASTVVTDKFGDPNRPSEPDRGRMIAGIGASLADTIIRARRDVVHDDWWKKFGRLMGTPVSRPRCEACGR